MPFFAHRRRPSLGQPLLDQGDDQQEDIIPPEPEDLPPSTPTKEFVHVDGLRVGTGASGDAGGTPRREVRHLPSECFRAPRARAVAPRPNPNFAAESRERSLGSGPRGDKNAPPRGTSRGFAPPLPRLADAAPSPLPLPQPISPSHAGKKWLRRTRQRMRSQSRGGSQEISYADQMRLEALREYQQRLAEPMTLNNDILIDFASRLINELTMRPYKTAMSLYGKTFTAPEYLEWAATQPEIRDQCDALFLGNELLTRGVFLPVSYGTTDALFWTPTLRPNGGTYRLVTKTKPQIMAAILGKLGKGGPGDPGGSGDATTEPSSAAGSPSSASAAAPASVRRAGSDPGVAGSTSASANGHGPGQSAKKRGILKRAKTAPPLDDVAEFEEYRRFRRLPRFARLRVFRARRALRLARANAQRRVRKARAIVAAPLRVVEAYLATRLGPHVAFAVAFPWIVAWALAFFARGGFFGFFGFLVGRGFAADAAEATTNESSLASTLLVLLAALFGINQVRGVDARQRRDLERRVRAEELGAFQGRRGHAKLHRDGSETADWWSEVLRSFWEGWLEFWLNRLLTRILTNVLNNVKPETLHTLEITTFRLGDAAPRIKSSRCWRGNENETILEWDLVWQTDQMDITLSAKVGGAKFAVPVPLRVFVKDLRIAGKFRLGLFWTRRKGGPYLSKLRLSFVDMPEHSVTIKPVTSSFIDVRDLPGVDTAIENALNKLLTNLLVEPNCVTWDVEKWWINRPVARVAATHNNVAGLSQEELEVMEEADKIRAAKGSSVTSMLAAGAGYSKQPTLTVAVSVHFAEIETDPPKTSGGGGGKSLSYTVKLKRGAKKYATDGAKAAPAETLVAVEGAEGGRGHHRRGSSGASGDVFHDASETAHARSASHAAALPREAEPSADPSDPTHARRFSDFAADYSPPSAVKKWVARPVWEDFARLDAFERQVDSMVDVKIVADDGAVVGSKRTVGKGAVDDVLALADGRLHTLQLPMYHPREEGRVIGVLHLRARVTAGRDDLVAAKHDRNPNATIFTAPKTYTKQAAMNAAGAISYGASGVAGAMRYGVVGALGAMPIPKKYVNSAAKATRAAAMKAVNEPARQGKWAARSVYKGVKKMWLGKEKYKALKKEKIAMELEAAERAAGYANAWKSATAGDGATARWGEVNGAASGASASAPQIGSRTSR